MDFKSSREFTCENLKIEVNEDENDKDYWDGGSLEKNLHLAIF